MDIDRFVDDLSVLGSGEELAHSLVKHFNIRFKPHSEVPSVIYRVKLDEILIELFRRMMWI